MACPRVGDDYFAGVPERAITLAIAMPCKPNVTPAATRATSPDMTPLPSDVAKMMPTSVIERTYPLNETPAAMGHVGEGHVSGKIIITV